MISLNSRITQVTVFQDRAEVTRQATIDLSKGAHVLYFDMLPASIAEKSIQVSGENLPVILQQVKFLKEHYTESPNEVVWSLQQKKQQLSDAKKQNDALQKRLQGRKRFLLKMVNRVTHPVKGQKKNKTEDWFKMLAFYQQQQIELDEKLHTATLQARQLAQRFHKIKLELQRFQGQRHQVKRKVIIKLQAQQAGTLTLNLAYMVRGASWEPYYDFRFFDNADQMEMIYQAVVYQNTEEPWENVALKLSTARPHISGRQPELQPLRIMANTPPPKPLPLQDDRSTKSSGGIFNRISDIMKANVNDSLDRIEDPEKVIRIMINDLQDSIVAVNQALAESRNQEQTIEMAYKKQSMAAQNWIRKAQIALEAENEDLARQALDRKQQADTQAEHYKNQYDQVAANSSKLSEKLRQLKDKLQEARMKESAWVAQNYAKAANSGAYSRYPVEPFEPQHFSDKFAKFEEKILKLEAEGELVNELNLTGQDVDDDLAKLRAKLKTLSSDATTSTPSTQATSGYIFTPSPFEQELAKLEQVQKETDAKNQRPKIARSSSKGTSGSTAVFFEIAGKHTVQNNDTDHQVTILNHRFATQLQYSSVPKLSPYTYLRAKTVNNTDYPLLAGSTNVFLDNNFVANASIDTVASSESFWTFLGIDEGVRVARKFLKKYEKKEGQVFGKKHKNMVYEYSMEAQNFKSKPIELVIKDQLPIAQNDEIKVQLLAPHYTEDTPQLKINKLKYLEWTHRLDSGQDLKIPFTFSITFPNDVWLK